MGSIRFPSQSDALSQATLNGDTLLPCRYKAGTVDDSDKAIPFNILQSSPVAVCNSSADMTNKIATVDNYPDFQLVNGREVVCYFVNGNTATNPSININGTGAISLEGSYWNAGTFLKLKYVDITVSGTRIQKWLIDLGSYNTKAQLNGALTNLKPTEYSTEGIVFEGCTFVRGGYFKVGNVCFVNIQINASSLTRWTPFMKGFPKPKLSQSVFHILSMDNVTDCFGYMNGNGQIVGLSTYTSSTPYPLDINFFYLLN